MPRRESWPGPWATSADDRGPPAPSPLAGEGWGEGEPSSANPTRSLTENIPATPGWTDSTLDEVFALLPKTAEVATARDAYADCLARSKARAAPSDMLGAEFEPCRGPLMRALRHAGLEDAQLTALTVALDAAEAEIAAES